MLHITYEKADSYPVALLIKESSFHPAEINKYYSTPLHNMGLTRDHLIVTSLPYRDNGKPLPAKELQPFLRNLLSTLDSVGTKYIYCADAHCFKALTKQRKAEPHLFDVLDCAIEDYTHMKVVLGLNHRSFLYNTANEKRNRKTLDTLYAAVQKTFTQLGSNVIHSGTYPSTPEQIKLELQELHKYDQLSCDIEGFSLDFHTAGVGTITFSWDEHNGIAFPVDLSANNSHQYIIRSLLKGFFETYKGTLVWHNSSYDLKCLIYNLWMKHSRDYVGMLIGVSTMTRRFHDTKIIAYLALNSTIRPSLSLKDLAHEHCGNWAEADIKDIRKIQLNNLLKYNLIDGLATNFVIKKYEPLMKMDKQQTIYESLLLPSQAMLIYMEMVGMPICRKSLSISKKKLETVHQRHLDTIQNNTIVQKFNFVLQARAMEKKNATLKTKQYGLDHFSDIAFNPNSTEQKQALLYELLELPVLDTTDSGKGSTKSKTLEKLINHTQDQEVKDLLEALIEFNKADKILTTFIPAFEKAHPDPFDENVMWLHGSFNVGGTVSGRLSSSEPNLQNLPSGSEYGKLVKSCFKAPPGWVMCGADFASLEDRISALQTKDPNKLKVYTDGYDGHSLRAYSYFTDQFPDIDPDDVESINSIETRYSKLRSRSKGPTFLLTYGGKAYGLVNTLGFSEEEAQSIYENYHELYKVSDEWVQKRLDQAAHDGYLDVAFGLRVRTPVLARTLRGHKTTPKQADSEARTAGNALGQSWGLLTLRAYVAFMRRLWDSPYKHDVLPISTIHDALYFIVRQEPHIIEWVNRVLIEEMAWQADPEISHPEVKITAELMLFWPNWANEIRLPNNASADEIAEICKQAAEDLKAA